MKIAYGVKIAYLLKTFPKRSETFILKEILELERQGVKLHVFSLREPTEIKMHAGGADVTAGISHLRHFRSAGGSAPDRTCIV